jgi:hypothetical protein
MFFMDKMDCFNVTKSAKGDKPWMDVMVHSENEPFKFRFLRGPLYETDKPKDLNNDHREHEFH